MGSALSMVYREQIIKEKQGGKTLKQIAIENGFAYSSTCRIWRLFKQQGLPGLVPKYDNCGPKTIKKSAKIHRCSLWLKRRHPDWGAPFILAILEDRYLQEDFPSVRTMQVWFRKAGLNLPRAKRIEPAAEKADRPHDCWQVDAKENLTLQDGSKACYLTVVDVKSGSALGAPVFPCRKN